jgi:hypothetical protein
VSLEPPLVLFCADHRCARPPPTPAHTGRPAGADRDRVGGPAGADRDRVGRPPRQERGRVLSGS